jgi:methylglutaconyl-CoA hydratase
MAAITTHRDGPVLHVTLARPATRNAFDDETVAELAAAFEDVADARAVVLGGEGPSFSAGADVDWMRRTGGLSEADNRTSARAMRAMFEAIDGCPAPVVVAAHGHALGGGAGLVACADVALAHRDTAFGFSEVRLGVVPAVISPFVLRAIGERQARRWFVTGERFDAETALRIGLVHEVVDDVDEAVGHVVAALLAAAPGAARAAKRIALDHPDGPTTELLIARARAGAEGQEGLAAFLERRLPSWAETDA